MDTVPLFVSQIAFCADVWAEDGKFSGNRFAQEAKLFYICRIIIPISMKHTIMSIGRFYLEGFRGMTLGRTLWLIILVKLFILFFVLRLFFFPDFLDNSTGGVDKEEYVSNELIHRASETGQN